MQIPSRPRSGPPRSASMLLAKTCLAATAYFMPGCAFASPLFSETYVPDDRGLISITVADADTGGYLRTDANVTVEGTLVSRSFQPWKGALLVQGVPLGETVVHVEAPGYVPTFQRVLVRPGTQALPVRLERHPYEPRFPWQKRGSYRALDFVIRETGEKIGSVAWRALEGEEKRLGWTRSLRRSILVELHGYFSDAMNRAGGEYYRVRSTTLRLHELLRERSKGKRQPRG